LSAYGISRLYNHQTRALDLLRHRNNVLLATPTASGKSLIFQLPILEAIADDSGASALLIFPFKALARDQARVFQEFEGVIKPQSGRPLVGIYDGDTPESERKKIRRNAPHILITNPDMIHYGILPYHTRWHRFIQSIRYVVVDEIHVYRGVFGSHVLQMFKRLHRILAHYGANPQFIACSATIGNPEELAEKILQIPVKVIDKSGAPAEGKAFISHFPDDRASTASVRMLEACVEKGLKTIVFTKSRRSTELIYRYILARRPDLAPRLAIYRAGFLPQHRRDIERKLFDNELAGVISTSALELGINIGGLDCCILVGFPGSVASLWQRAGRVGRQNQPSLLIYIAGEDALDRYWYEHAGRLVQSPVEKAVVYEDNDAITDAHLQCAADELRLHPNVNMTVSDYVLGRIHYLVQANRLLECSDGGQYVCRGSMPQRLISIRSVGDSYEIVDGVGLRIGDIDGFRVFKECHEGAIYLHAGGVFRVVNLDRDNFRVRVEPGPEDVYTQALSSKETDILEIIGSIDMGDGFIVQYGRLRVREKVTGYKTRRILDGSVVSHDELDFPELVFETRGLWMSYPQSIIDEMIRAGHHPMSGLHAFEHALIGLYPLISLCDRNDLAGISTQFHHQTQSAAVFVYDGYPGGLGLAESALDRFRELIVATRNHVASCPCETGCPYCIQSPKCGSGNEPLDKAATLFLMNFAAGDSGERNAVSMTHNQSQSNAPGFSLPTFAIPPLPDPSLCPPDTELVFDIETQLSADDVGGWHHADRMRIAICVVYDIQLQRYEFYHETDAGLLIQRLSQASRIIGYNSERFDFSVLKGYTTPDVIHQFKSLDLLNGIQDGLGHRTSLQKIAEATVHAGKSADGLQSLQWWKEGRIDLIAEYCQHDVDITHQVYAFGKTNGFVLHPHRTGTTIRVPVRWQ
ncbi:DEAD/DEAH box helicase, partial [bacterium]|nr:DEAD/DEAH box helicase [candidate division CSSED10-310 bacterium]